MLNNKDVLDQLTEDKLSSIQRRAQVNMITSVNGQTGNITITKASIGLGNVDNTSDVNKPVSTAQQTALNLKSNIGHGHVIADITSLQTTLNNKLETSLKGASNGLAELDSNGKVPLVQINDSILGQMEYKGLWNASTNSPTLSEPTTDKGEYYIVSTGGTRFSKTWEVGDWIVSNGATFDKIDNTDAVSSVHGRTGNVTAQTADYASFYVRHDTASQGLSGGAQSNARVNINAQVAGSYANASHTHPISDITNLQSTLNGKEPTFSKNTAFNKNFGTTAGTVAQGNDSRFTDARTPLSHTHGNITNTGAIGSTANLPIITTTSGVLTVGSFGTGANTFAQGNDSRINNGQTAFGWGNHASVGYANKTTISSQDFLDRRDLSSIINSIGSTARTYSDLAFARSGSSNAGSVISIETNIRDNSTMFWVEFDVYEYTSSRGVHRVIVKGYNTSTQIANAWVMYRGNASSPVVTLGKNDSTGKLIVRFSTGNGFNYPYVHIRKAMTTHSGASDVDGVGWSISFSDISSSYNVTPTLEKAWSNQDFANNSSNWNTAYSWGNHAGLYRPISYVPSWSEITSKPSTFTPSAHTLGSHSDVTITSNTSGEILMWNGSAWINRTLAEASISLTSHTHNASDITSGTIADARLSGTYTGVSISGNAGTATTLQTSRTINGTSFNGSGNITTANWGTSRTITIGSTGKSVNGSGNVSWSLSEIGADNASNLSTGTLPNARFSGTYTGITRLALNQPTLDSNGAIHITVGDEDSVNFGAIIIHRDDIYSSRNRSMITFENSSGTQQGLISSGNGSTTYGTSSDYRLKENITHLSGKYATSLLKQLQVKNFNFKNHPSILYQGFLAHEVQDIVPYAVTGKLNGKEMQTLDHSKLVPILTASLQEALSRIEILEKALVNQTKNNYF